MVYEDCGVCSGDVRVEVLQWPHYSKTLTFGYSVVLFIGDERAAGAVYDMLAIVPYLCQDGHDYKEGDVCVKVNW